MPRADKGDDEMSDDTIFKLMSLLFAVAITVLTVSFLAVIVKVVFFQECL